MSSTLKGMCLCGASEYNFVGGVKFAIQCHCRDCQHISGGGHLPQIAVPSDQFASLGKIKVYRTQV